MYKEPPNDKITLALRIANGLILLFWVVYFINGFLHTHTSIEVIKDFDEFNIAGPGGSRNTSYKKMVTAERTFTVYTDENEFFTKDTLELRVTPLFGLVTQYRKFSRDIPQEWIHNELSRYRNTLLLVLSIGLMLLSILTIFLNPDRIAFKVFSLLCITGAIIFLFSLIT